MKRIIFILIFLFLSLPANALIYEGIPVETVITGMTDKTFDFYLWEKINDSSTYCEFDGQKFRVRVVITFKVAPMTWRSYDYTAMYYARLDNQSTKFVFIGGMYGNFNTGDEEFLAVMILDRLDQLLAPPEDDEYNDSGADIIEA